MKKLLLILVLVLSACGSPKTLLSGNAYYVSPTGSDANPGTLALPFKTIQKAANISVAGDTILVRGGTYSNGISLTHSGSAGAYITFQAYPGETPIITGSGWYGFSDYGTSASYTVIDGFEFAGNPTFEFGLYFKASNNLILKNNKIHDIKLFGISVSNSNTGEISNNVVFGTTTYSGIWGDNILNYDIHNNTTYNNTQNGIGVSHGTTNTIIHNNISYGNGCGTDQRYTGIAIEVSSERNKVYNNLVYNNCHANYITNSSNNEVYNNTFYGNAGSEGYDILFGDWEGSITENNIFTNNIFVITRSSDHAIGNFNSGTAYNPLNNAFNYNDYYYTLGSDKSDLVRLNSNYTFTQWKAIGKEANGFRANPQLDTSYKSKSTSPVIDKGVTISLTDDLAGVLRPQGAGYDIGAYEFVFGATTPTKTATATRTPTKTRTPMNTPTPIVSAVYDFENGWGGLAQNVQNGTMLIVNDTSYDGSFSVLSTYDGSAGGNGFERVLTTVSWRDGDSIWYGMAILLPVGFYAAQGGEIALMRWDNWSLYGSGDDIGGEVVWGVDHMARIMTQVGTTTEVPISPPFTITEGEWHWMEVHQVLGTNGLSEMYLDGNLLSSVTAKNNYGREITRIRFGLVAIDQNRQAYPISLHFDRVYIGQTQLGALSKPKTPTPSPTLTPTNTATITPTLTPTVAITPPVTLTPIPSLCDPKYLPHVCVYLIL